MLSIFPQHVPAFPTRAAENCW